MLEADTAAAAGGCDAEALEKLGVWGGARAPKLIAFVAGNARAVLNRSQLLSDVDDLGRVETMIRRNFATF